MLVETLFCVDAILSKVIKSSKISRLQGLDVKKKMVHQILKLKVKNLIYLQVEIEHYLMIHIDVLHTCTKLIKMLSTKLPFLWEYWF